MRWKLQVLCHALAGVAGWIQFGMAVWSGETQVAYLSFAVGCYGLSMAGVVLIGAREGDTRGSIMKQAVGRKVECLACGNERVTK